MRKLSIAFFFLLLCVSVSAQTSNYAVVDSEKIYKSLAKYNQATISLDNLSAKYKAEVDAMYKSIETMFTNYQSQKSSLSQSARLSREKDIIAKEKQAKELQDKYFGEDGALASKTESLMKPIRESVQSVIGGYARSNGYLMILEKDTEGSMIYLAPAVDKTDEIIKMLNQ